MTIADKAMLVTGANRGLGQALVEEALEQRRKGGGRPHPPALGPPGGAGHAHDPGPDQRGADPGGRRSVRVDNPQPPLPGTNSEGPRWRWHGPWRKRCTTGFWTG